MIQEEEKKLSQAQDSYQTLKDQLQGDRQEFKTPKEIHSGPTPARTSRIAV